ncbi:serpin family protein [candidate division WOR-3 bacterium]|nr:serpin family protein [candidate division WOR-3 bacterium]
MGKNEKIVLLAGIFFLLAPIKTNGQSIFSLSLPFDTGRIVSGMNEFSIDFYKTAASESDQNMILSPFSVHDALTMTYEGADGATAEQMRNVLRLGFDISQTRYEYMSLLEKINSGGRECTLSAANAIWTQYGYPFLGDFISAVERYYGGKAVNMDFENDPEGSRQKINIWVEENTAGKITDLLSPGQINPMTTLVLTNAIYFKGIWLYTFDSEKTKKSSFSVSEDKTVETDMMFLDNSEARFGYYEDEEVQILEMPYKDGTLSMVVFLPKVPINSFEESLDAFKMDYYMSSLTSSEVVIYFPKFKIEAKFNLNEVLNTMGMTQAFIPGAADFSGMTGNRDLFISYVIHQAFIAVDEEGTEAAAATAVLMERTSVSMDIRNVFNADHPFLFVIKDNETGCVLFMGKLTDPAVN